MTTMLSPSSVLLRQVLKSFSKSFAVSPMLSTFVALTPWMQSESACVHCEAVREADKTKNWVWSNVFPSMLICFCFDHCSVFCKWTQVKWYYHYNRVTTVYDIDFVVERKTLYPGFRVAIVIAACSSISSINVFCCKSPFVHGCIDQEGFWAGGFYQLRCIRVTRRCDWLWVLLSICNGSIIAYFSSECQTASESK